MTLGFVITPGKLPLARNKHETRNNAQLSPTLPTAYSSNGLENLESKTRALYRNQDGRHSQNPARAHRRDLGSPCHRFRQFCLQIPQTMRSRIQIVGSIVSAAYLPHRRLRPEEYVQVVPDVPGARGESCPLCQGSTILNARVRQRSREVLRIHPVVYERGEGGIVGVWKYSTVVDILTLGVTTVCDLLVHQYGYGHSRAGPGCYGTAAELG